MFTLQRKIGTSVNIFFKDFEITKPELDAIDCNKKLDDHNKRFEDVSKYKEIRNGIGKMIDNIFSKEGMDNFQKNTFDFSRNTMTNSVDNIFNNPTLTGKQRADAIYKIVSEFQENINKTSNNKTNNKQENQQEKQSIEQFQKILSETIGANRIASQEINANFANKLSNNTACPANGGPYPPKSPLESPEFLI